MLLITQTRQLCVDPEIYGVIAEIKLDLIMFVE